MQHIAEATSPMGALDAGDADPGRRDERRSSGRGAAPDTVARDRLLRLTSRLLGVPGILLILGDADHRSIASRVLTPALATLHTPAVIALCQHATDADRPLLVADVRAQPPTHDATALAGYGVVAYAYFPLVAPDGAALGALCVLDTRTRDWTAGEVATLADLAAAMTALVMGDRTAGTVQAGEARLLALHDASVLLAAQRNPTAVLEQLLQQAVTLLGAGSGTFYRWDADAGLLRCLYNWRVPAHDSTPDQRPGEGLAGQTFARQTALIVNDYQTWAWAMPSGLRAGLRAALCVPLIRSGITLGVVVIRAYERGGGFTDDDARLLGLFADQGAIALENAGLYATAQRELAERARAEAALRTSEARFRDLFDNASDLLYTHDLSGRLIALNRTAERLTGYTLTDDRALHIRDLVPPEHRDSVRRAAERTMVGEDRMPWELTIRTRDGRRLSLEITTRLIRDETGLPVGVQGIGRDIGERKVLEARLAHQATHDLLTGLPNRILFLDRLTHALARRERGARPTLLFVDLDGFKGVNDGLGHEAGDRVLRAVAERLHECVRVEDTAARFGGDEFAILLPAMADRHTAVRIAARIIERVSAPILLGAREVVVTPSVGIALGTGRAIPPEELLRRADVAMYRAKAAGKGRHAIFRPGMRGTMRTSAGRTGSAGRAVCEP